MRRFLLSLCLFAVAALAAAGCKKKSSEPPEPSASEAPPDPAKRNPPNVRKVVTPITTDEVGPLLPTPDGARVIKEPTKAQYGERIEATFCFDQGEIPALSETVKTTLTGAGWGGIVIRENPTVKDRSSLTAARPPFMMTGNLQKTATVPECSQEKGQTLLSLNVHKQIPRPDGLPLGRQPGLMRPLPGVRPMPPGLQPVGPRAPNGTPPVAPTPGAPVAPTTP
jgi:hypothetical protein